MEEARSNKDEATSSHTFAIELAYIIEHYGDELESDAREVLDLYMKGAKSLVLAVSFAQRNQTYCSILWSALIDHCLVNDKEANHSPEQLDGSLFGLLLEAAALSGADLANLITKIPHGMSIVDLRSRLVAAVKDYRMKLGMHEAASETATQDLVSLFREVQHRCRRGMRGLPQSRKSSLERPPQVDGRPEADQSLPRAISGSLRTVERREHYRLSLPLPIR